MSEQMTAEQAQQFEHGESTTSAMILMMAAQERGCGCLPYQDWYTYRRWQAQGYQVQKGEHGVRLTVFKTVEEVDRKTGKKKTKSVPKGTTVFCKCQVRPIKRDISEDNDNRTSVSICRCQVKPIEQPGLPMAEVPVHTIEPPTVKPKPVSVGNGDGRLIEKLRTMADRMQKEIDDKKRPMTQNPTPKRMREFASRCHDGANLERGQAAMRAMADALELGTLPDILKDTAKTTKGNILSMVRTSWRSDGYYEGGDSGEYADTTPEGRALQAMINGAGPNMEELELQRMEQKAKLMVGQVPGFFPTPRAIVEQLLDAAYLYPGGLRILEPSAGSGAIADVIRELHPSQEIDVCEWNSTLQGLLEKKGYNVVGYDCMELKGQWHRVIMNPPFENKTDLKHVKHLYENCLAPGGTLVSVLAYSGRDDIADCFEWMEKRFAGWLDDKDWDALLFPRDAFKESGTGVSTCGLILSKKEG